MKTTAPIRARPLSILPSTLRSCSCARYASSSPDGLSHRWSVHATRCCARPAGSYVLTGGGALSRDLRCQIRCEPWLCALLFHRRRCTRARYAREMRVDHRAGCHMECTCEAVHSVYPILLRRRIVIEVIVLPDLRRHSQSGLTPVEKARSGARAPVRAPFAEPRGGPAFWVLQIGCASQRCAVFAAVLFSSIGRPSGRDARDFRRPVWPALRPFSRGCGCCYSYTSSASRNRRSARPQPVLSLHLRSV